MSRRPYRSKATHGPRVDGSSLACRACGVRLPVDEFRVLTTGSRASWCKPCAAAATQEWRASNRAEINARRRAQYRARKGDDADA